MIICVRFAGKYERAKNRRRKLDLSRGRSSSKEKYHFPPSPSGFLTACGNIIDCPLHVLEVRIIGLLLAAFVLSLASRDMQLRVICSRTMSYSSTSTREWKADSQAVNRPVIGSLAAMADICFSTRVPSAHPSPRIGRVGCAARHAVHWIVMMLSGSSYGIGPELTVFR